MTENNDQVFVIPILSEKIPCMMSKIPTIQEFKKLNVEIEVFLLASSLIISECR